MATFVIAVNTEEDAHDYHPHFKTPAGKKLGLSNFAPSPHCPFLWPSHEGPPLVWVFLVLESPHIYYIMV